MGSLGTVYVDAKIDPQQVQAEATKAGKIFGDGLSHDAAASGTKTVRTFGQAGQKEAETQASKIKSTLARGFEFGAAFYGGEALFRGVADGIKTVVDSADQLNESTEQVDRVFGESSSSVLQFGKDAAHSYGLSASAADLMSVKLGALLTNLKLPQDEAAKMSVKLIQLAADLAAFNHTDTASAEQALQSALAGRTQGLKQYGIVVDAVSVQQQALKDGLIHTISDALDPAAKAQATYEVILQRSGVQQDAFSRQSGSLAGQTKILKAEVTDAGAAIGQKLVPVLVDGAKGLQDVGHAAGDVVHFFQDNQAAVVVLAGVLGASLVPKLTELTISAEQFVATNLERAFAASAGGIREMGTALLENPELYGLTAALAAAGAAVALFGGHERSVTVDTQGLTDAVKRQTQGLSGAVSDTILSEFETDKLGSRGETILAYLQRYKLSVSDIIASLSKGDAGSALKLSSPIFFDQSVSESTSGKLQNFYTGIANAVSAARKEEEAEAKQHADTNAALDKTPQGRFVLFLQGVQTAQAALTKSTSDNNATISGQIDLLKQYSAQADVTAADIQKHLLDNIKTLAGEGDNLKTLSANGVDPKFIQQLVKEGPEYVAAVASSSKQLQVQLGVQFEQGLTQQMHTAAEAARAEAPQAAAVVAGAAQLELNAQANAIKTKFYAAVSSAVGQARNIAADGGSDTASAFGIHGEAGRNTVLQHFLATLPEPVRIAAESALGIATTAGGQLPTNLASAINSHLPKASQAAENLRLAVQNKIDMLHGKTIDVVTQDNASAALGQITSNIKTLEAYNNTLKATRIGAADGMLVKGPGGPHDDLAGIFALSNGETVVPAHLTPKYAPMFARDGIPGFADGGYVTDQLTTHPFVQSFADALTGGSLAALVSGASGGASSSQSVQAWVPTILQALALAGAPASWLSAEETIMRLESGGNPTIQNTGYTAGGGHPTGLMQMLPQTFLAHALPGLTNIVNGLDNLVSSVRYQESEYGSPFNIPGVVRGSYGGYDNGGPVGPGWTHLWNGTGKVENVQTASQRDEHAELLRQLIKVTDRQGSDFAARLDGRAKKSHTDGRTRTR